MPAQLPGTPVPLAEPQTRILWTVPLPAAAIGSPLIAGEVVLVAHLPGIVAAYRRSDGRALWRAEIEPEQPIATDGTLLLASDATTIHALRMADGSVAWRVPTVSLTAPLLVKDGWIITATAGALTARRAADGTTVWTVASAVERESPAIAGDVLFVPLVDGRLVARNLVDGAIRWERRLGGSPGEPLVVGDEVFVGASDRRFYCVDAASGEIEWPIRVGAQIRGRAASDGQRIFFVALDNLVRAVDHWTGAQRWQQGVPFRPLVGPTVAGGSVFVAGPGVELRAFRAATGAASGSITFPARIAIGPAYAETAAGVVVAAVTGNLEESWNLSLTAPIPAVR